MPYLTGLSRIELNEASERCCRDRFAKEFVAMLTVLGEKRGLLHFSTNFLTVLEIETNLSRRIRSQMRITKSVFVFVIAASLLDGLRSTSTQKFLYD